MTPLILEYLTALVACDTQNPPRTIEPRGRLYEFLDSVCGRDFKIDVVDWGVGRIAWHARRGEPRVLFNVHLDTVPAGTRWTNNPLELRVIEDRAVGLGACDIKGAAACLLALAKKSEAPLELLFTTDEEGSDPCCVQRFIDRLVRKPELVVVAEPTGGLAVTGHRGYLSRQGTFRGRAGHTSLPSAARHSAVHQLVEWSAAALQFVSAEEQRAGAGVDFCFNLGVISGGTKNNIVAEQAEIRWSARLPAGPDAREFVAGMTRLGGGAEAHWETTFLGPSLPSTGPLREKARQYLASLGLPVAPDVDFWTEASLFSTAGWPAIVLGPGDIAQAHSADEWVSLGQLKTTYEHYWRIAHAD